MENQDGKCPYVCGALTELPKRRQEELKNFYSKIADVCGEVLGVRAFVPHEHYDPIKNASYTPEDVDRAERRQVCELTNLLIVATIAPSWGGGIEVEMAHRNNVPIILLCQKRKFEQRKISRLLRGSPAVRGIILYRTKEEALRELEEAINDLFCYKL